MNETQHLLCCDFNLKDTDLLGISKHTGRENDLIDIFTSLSLKILMYCFGTLPVNLFPVPDAKITASQLLAIIS